MGRIGKVIKSYIDKLSGSGTNAQLSSVEEFSGDQRTAQIFGPCNEDFAPPESCMTFDQSLGSGRGYLVSTAYHNQLIPPQAIHGERRLFSTNKAGDTVLSEVFLKQDGTIIIKNDNATILVPPSGPVQISKDTEINGYINGAEKSSDPANPANGHFTIWQSTGAGLGDQGDLMIKITSGSVSRYGTISDFSSLLLVP